MFYAFDGREPEIGKDVYVSDHAQKVVAGVCHRREPCEGYSRRNARRRGEVEKEKATLHRSC